MLLCAAACRSQDFSGAAGKGGLLWAFDNTEIMNVVAEAHMVMVMLVLLRTSHRRMRGCSAAFIVGVIRDRA